MKNKREVGSSLFRFASNKICNKIFKKYYSANNNTKDKILLK